MTAASGYLLSPMYPESNYPDSFDFEWRFHLFPGDTFELDLDRLSPHGLSTRDGDGDYVRLFIDGRNVRDLDVNGNG
jgi:hypothetical protein